MEVSTDVRVTQTNIKRSSATYHDSVCDGGGTTQYYSEIALRGLSSNVQRVSKTVTLSHC